MVGVGVKIINKALESSLKAINLRSRVRTAKVISRAECNNIHVSRVLKGLWPRIGWCECQKLASWFQDAVHLIHQLNEWVDYSSL